MPDQDLERILADLLRRREELANVRFQSDELKKRDETPDEKMSEENDAPA